VTNHFYISRPIFLHRTGFDAWPQDLQDAMREAVTASIAFQRELAIEEDVQARKALADQGCEVVELTAEEHAAFSKAVEPLWADARKQFGKEIFDLMPG
jgi:TRAP-type transport system periplasmic protein